MHAKSPVTKSSVMQSDIIARRTAGRGLRAMRRTALALPVTGTMPAFAQNMAHSGPGYLEPAPSAIEGSSGIMGNGLDLLPLNSTNSNLPPTSSRVLPAQIGDANYMDNAKVGMIRVSVAQNSLPADGQTPARLTINLLD